MNGVIERLRANRQLVLFVVGAGLLAAGGGVFEIVFPNYLKDTFNIAADARGALEFPRELPGFLTALFAGLLFFLPETRIAAVSSLVIGVGLIGMGLGGSVWWGMMVFMILWSAGSHLMMPVSASLAIALGTQGRHGRRLGQLRAVSLAAGIIGAAVIWTGMKYLHWSYAQVFIGGGVVAIGAAVVFHFMNMPDAHLKRPRFVYNRKYRLYYVLALLFGARKQIFITFGPWVIIEVFKQPPTIFAEMLVIGAVIGIFFQPLLGRAIDRFGERTVLMVDAVFIFGVCMGYAFSHGIANKALALWVVCACYVGDMLLFGVNMARSTYLRKIALKDEDVSPTLAAGTSIDHIASMTLPAAAGVAWVTSANSYQTVFFAAAGIAVIMFICAALIRTPAAAGAAEAPAAAPAPIPD
ncbi:MAG: MFS transporter [Planctomycetaceae bacterium]|nr:MFS transporter [Planctomycetaceae bacterium]